MAKGKHKVRVQFGKNRSKKPRDADLTRKFRGDDPETELAKHGERIRAKGDLSRKRTVKIEDGSDSIAITDEGRRGRVLSVQGLYCTVVTDDGKSHQCYTRRLLKSFESDARGVTAPGDWVWFRPAPDDEGMILRVEPRDRILTRRYRQKERVIAANVDQVLIVTSLVNPVLKPNLVDRYLVSAEQSEIPPIVAFNKADLTDPSFIQPMIGLYSQLGYRVYLTSAVTGQGIGPLKDSLAGQETVVVGQSGVGKSSLLNALEPEFQLKVRDVSNFNQKGRHTTTTSRLLKLTGGGVVIDTPGVRQFELWDISPEHLDGLFIEFRPFLPHCHLPGCSHTHEETCAVKDAVAQGLISTTRYENYIRIYRDEPASE